MAAEIARIESDADTSDEAARQHALREVVQHCIHGVDRNPLAVELCKTALWIETVEPGKPLTFLDAHIQLGDSLVGILDPEMIAGGIPGDVYKDLTGDDKAICRAFKKRNSQAGDSVRRSLFDEENLLEVAIATADIDAMPEDTLGDIERKSNAWDSARRDDTRIREELRANLFVGAYFAPKTKETAPWVPDTEDLNRLNKGIAQRLASCRTSGTWRNSTASSIGTSPLRRSCRTGDSTLCSGIRLGRFPNSMRKSTSPRASPQLQVWPEHGEKARYCSLRKAIPNYGRTIRLTGGDTMQGTRFAEVVDGIH